jgi:hypothetical protein
MAISKADKKAQRLEKKAKREQAKDEVMAARGRTGIGFGITYLATQIVPAVVPSVAPHQASIDLLLAGGGGFLAFTDDSETGDYAMGAGLVGLTQTLDNIAAKLTEWFSK